MNSVCAHATSAVEMRNNAAAQLLPEAGATEERTLEAVRCSGLLGGSVLSTCNH
jgi:hypothetical protein